MAAFAVADSSYPQDVVDFFEERDGLPGGHLAAVAVMADGRVWAGGSQGLACLQDGRWSAVGVDQPQAALGISELLAVGDALWIGTHTGVARLAGGRWTRWWHDAPAPTRTVRGLAADDRGVVWALIHRGDASDSRLSPWDLWRFEHDAWQPVEHPEPNLRAIAPRPGGGLLAVTDDQLLHVDAGVFEPVGLPALPAEAKLTAVAAAGDRVAVGSTAGLVLIEGGNARLLTGQDGLPVEAITGLAFGPDSALWVADAKGMARLHEGGWRYYSAGRWLPAGPAGFTPDGQGGLWTAGAGVSHLHYQAMTLAAKAQHYEDLIVKYHDRHHFVSPVHFFDAHRPEAGGIKAATDNDGLRTGIYLGAAAIRAHLDGRPQDVERARQAFSAMALLESKTGLPGFPARAVAKKGEVVSMGSGEWHESPDPEWLWKGDTSSDETAGHYFGYYLHYRYGPAEDRAALQGLVSRITARIQDAGYFLPDYDGLPTRWARWEPSFLFSPEGADQTRLNSMEILSHLKVAHYITGESRFDAGYRELLFDNHYLENVRGGVCLDTGGLPQYDDHLAFLTWYPLVMLEEDPELKGIYREAIKADWEKQRLEQNVLFNYIYGATEQGDPESKQSVEALRDIPLWLSSASTFNMHRADLRQVPGHGGRMYYVPVPWHSRGGSNWGDNFYQLERTGDGRSVNHGSFWLAAYWLGRLHGFIR